MTASNFRTNRSEIHPQDVERVTSALQQHMHGMTPIFEASYRIKAANGQSNNRPWQSGAVERTRPGYSHDGHLKKYSAIKTYRRAAGTVCPLPGEYFRRSGESATPIFVVIEVNHSFSTITGKSREQVIKQPFELALYPAVFCRKSGQLH